MIKWLATARKKTSAMGEEELARMCNCQTSEKICNEAEKKILNSFLGIKD